MTKEEHIKYWVDTARKDWKTVQVLFSERRYMHSLFWAHLVIEKLAKAHWVRTHEDNYPPRIHNIKSLLEQSEIDLGEETMKFLEDFNNFQLSGRYPDYIQKIYKRCTKVNTGKKLEKIKEVRQCLLKML